MHWNQTHDLVLQCVAIQAFEYVVRFLTLNDLRIKVYMANEAFLDLSDISSRVLNCY